jgi:hypothetical protein
MRTMDGVTLEQIQGGSWLSEFGGGMACGISIGMAIETGGILVPVAIATCLWALG